MEIQNNKGSWVIGGTTLIGLGIGLVFLKTSAVYFVASIIVGIGSGLVIVPLCYNEKNDKKRIC